MTFKKWWMQIHPAEVDELKKEFEDCFNAGCQHERNKCWHAINKMIKRGPLAGDGCDEQSQRNGLVLASNVIMRRNWH
jgi:hypothetical protein